MSACIGWLGEYSTHTFLDGVCENCGKDMDSAETLAKIKDYAEGLRIWHKTGSTLSAEQIATDILHILGDVQ